MSKKRLIAEVLNSAERILAGISFRKRDEGIFDIPVHEGVDGWLGLNLATTQAEYQISINPVIGIRHNAIETLVVDLSGQNHGYQPTIRQSLGYLLPERRFMSWVFESGFDNDLEVARMVKAIELYGIPFMQSHSALDIIITSLQELKLAYAASAAYRLPAAYLVSGRKELATSYVQKRLETISNKRGPFFDNYKIFASNVIRASQREHS